MESNAQQKSRLKKIGDSRLFRWSAGITAALLLMLYCVSYLVDEPLRKNMENSMNRDLKGYSVRIPKLHLQLIGLSITLKGLTVMQQAHPDPPIVFFPVLKASIHWSGILQGKLVAEFKLDHPDININLLQLRSEAADTVSIKERGWQQAVEAIYPLKINSLKISNANVTYIGEDPKRPLVLSHLNLQASNIRNINLPDKVYPSSFHVDSAIFETGRGSIDGKANFLGTPFPGIKGRLTLEKVPMDYFNTAIHSPNVSIHGGVLRASGNAEYAPTVKIAHLENLEIAGMNLEYIHSQQTAKLEKKRAVVAGKAALKLSNNPEILIQADQVKLSGCTLGMENKSAKKPYRIFLTDTDLQLNNFSNQFTQGKASVRMKGKFMGSGATSATADFLPEKGGPSLDLFIKMEETQLTSMNNVLRSYGDFDVSAGVFSLVSEIHIKNKAISGYMKPFFRDMNVYDSKQDKGRSVTHQVYEMLVGAAATVLENRSKQEVATRIDISGQAVNPETSTFQIVVELVRNAFFRAMLPSFEKAKPKAGKI